MKNNSDMEEVRNKLLLIAFIIVLTISIGAMCFVAGLVFSGYISRNDKCITIENDKTIIENKTYAIDDANIKYKLNRKVDLLLNGNIVNNSDKESIVLNNIIDKKSIDEVKNIYKELFKEEYTFNKNECFKIKDNNIERVCNKDIDIADYSYAFIEDSNYYYVFVSYGEIKKKDDKYIFYIDNTHKDVYIEDTDKDNLVINETNYELFSKYKVVFFKDNFYFKNIERID